MTFGGHSLKGSTIRTLLDKGIVLVPEGRGTFNEHSVLENLTIGAYRRKLTKSQLESEYGFCFELFPKLKERQNQNAGSLSGGEQQILSIAKALMAAPKILVIDEPCMGLSPIAVEELVRHFESIKSNRNMTFLVSEQNFGFSQAVSDSVTIIDCGKAIATGPSQKVLSLRNVQESLFVA